MYLSMFLSIYLPRYLSIFYLSGHFSIHLSVYLSLYVGLNDSACFVCGGWEGCGVCGFRAEVRRFRVLRLLPPFKDSDGLGSIN